MTHHLYIWYFDIQLRFKSMYKKVCNFECDLVVKPCKGNPTGGKPVLENM